MSTSEPSAKSMFLPLLFIASILVVVAFLVVLVATSPNRTESLVPTAKSGGGGSDAGTSGGASDADVIIKTVKTELTTDPFASVWNQATTKTVMVVPQQMAAPALQKATIESVDLDVLTDGKQIGFRFTWYDASADYNVDTERFCDAVAIQFPLDADANFTMGNRGKKVQIIQWKALWQKDLDEHFQDVADVHPYTWSDLYWFSSGGAQRVPDAFQNPVSQQWFIARQSGNPVSKWDRKQPLDEYVAEGYGTLTSQTDVASQAKGMHRDNKWRVVILRPLTTSDSLDFQFKTDGQLAIAVWDGKADNVAGRKHHSYWMTFKVKP